MKTSKLILALSLILIFATGFNTLYAQKNLSSDLPEKSKAQKVCYVVRIENMKYLNNTGFQYLVQMSDETGRQIAPSQAFQPGVSDYSFFENGTVRGTRVARMIQLPNDQKSYNILSCSKTGVFYGGASYLFIIRPVPAETIAGTDIR